MKYYLVGGFNPSENISQIGNLPQIGVKNKKYLSCHHLDCKHSLDFQIPSQNLPSDQIPIPEKETHLTGAHRRVP